LSSTQDDSPPFFCSFWIRAGAHASESSSVVPFPPHGSFLFLGVFVEVPCTWWVSSLQVSLRLWNGPPPTLFFRFPSTRGKFSSHFLFFPYGFFPERKRNPPVSPSLFSTNSPRPSVGQGSVSPLGLIATGRAGCPGALSRLFQGWPKVRRASPRFCFVHLGEGWPLFWLFISLADGSKFAVLAKIRDSPLPFLGSRTPPGPGLPLAF